MNRIDQLFQNNPQGGLLNVYFTAGFPTLNDTIRIAKALEDAGADLLEIGIPYSDPIADGPTIQESSGVAIANGMTVKLLMSQLENLREHVQIPVLLMGYLNPVLQYGMEKFLADCQRVGVDGLILPDLPMYEYDTMYKHHFQQAGIHPIFLITPQTADVRIHQLDQLATGFIYMVSSASTTGAKTGIDATQIQYFERIKAMNLQTKRLIGFGISDQATFQTACQYADGAIIGSAFINQLKKDPLNEAIYSFIKSIKS